MNKINIGGVNHLSAKKPQNNKFTDLINKLSELFENEKYLEVISLAEKSLKVYPNSYDLLFVIGNANYKISNFQKSIDIYTNLIKHNPTDEHLHHNLGKAFLGLSKYAPALSEFDKAILINDKNDAFFLSKALAFKDLFLHKDAIDNLKKTIKINPENLEAQVYLGSIYRSLGMFEKSVEVIEVVLKKEPNNDMFIYQLSSSYRLIGNKKKAISILEDGIRHNQNSAYLYFGLCLITDFKGKSDLIGNVKSILNNNNLSDELKSMLYFVLFRIENDNENFSDAFNHLQDSGKYRQSFLRYDKDKDDAIFDDVKKTTKGILKFKVNKVVKAPTPIFVIGMPRSGTTLTERILSSHSNIEGLGELPLMSFFANGLVNGRTQPSQEMIEKIRDTYLSRVKSISKDSPFFVDKMPSNFINLAVIKAAFPEAKIIHTIRDASAVCWSNFSNYFTNGNGYSFNIKDTVDYFLNYRNLMDFYLESNIENVYNLDYESLVLNPEREIEKLLSYIGVDIEKECLDHRSGDRSVTASYEQTQEEIYTGSKDQWKKYSSYLDDFFQRL